MVGKVIKGFRMGHKPKDPPGFITKTGNPKRRPIRVVGILKGWLLGFRVDVS
jgi:hypothetical protein